MDFETPVELFGTSLPTETASSGVSSWLPNLSDFSLGVSGFAPQALGLASEAAAPAAGADSGGGGGFWSNLFKTGGNILTGAGKVASSVLPIASLGTSIMGALNQRDLMEQVARQVPLTQEAVRTQIDSARQGQALAPQAAAVAPEIKALAPRFDELSKLVQEKSAGFGDLSGEVRTRVAGPQVDYGNKLLALADSGMLLDADKAKLDDWEQRAIADAESYLARAGQGDSTARESIIREIRQKRAAAESQVLAGYRDQAMQFLQGGGASLVSGAGALSQEEIQALIQSGALTAEQASILGASVMPLTAAGSILAGSAGAAGGAAALSKAEEQTLEELISGLQAQLGLASSRG